MSAKRATDWWETERVTVPVVENVPLKQHRRRRRVYTVYLWAAAMLLPLALLAVIILAGQGLGAGPAVQNQTSTTTDLAAAQAQVQVERWIAGEPSPLPGGRVVAYTGATTKTPAPDKGSDEPPLPVTSYGFVLTDTAGNLYTTSVEMQTSPERGAVPIGTPALVPVPPSDTTAAGSVWPWPGVEQGSARPAFTVAVDAWSKAYTSGSPEALKQTVGDPSEDRSYMPLSGLTFTTPAVGQVGALWAEDQDKSIVGSTPRQVMLRVTFQAVWAGQSTTATGGKGAATMTYDLLLDRADTAAPAVVAWNAPGTAALTPYSNAVTGRTLTSASAPPASPTPLPGSTVSPSTRPPSATPTRK